MSKKFSQEKTIKDISRRATNYLKDNEELLRKHKLIMRPVINFLKSNHVPFLSRIALWIVGMQGGKADIQFGEKNK